MHKYQEIIKNRGEHSAIQVFVATKFIFDFLRIEWEKNMWDLQELQYTCLAIDASCEELNPNNFIDFQYPYLDQVNITSY